MIREQMEDRLREMFDNAPVGVFQTTIDGRPVMVNRRLAAMFRYDTPQEILDTVTDATEAFCVHPEHCRQIVQSAAESGEFVHAEVECRRRDGTTFPADVYLRAVSHDGRAAYIEGSVEDITERKRSEEELRQSELKYKFLFDTMTQGVVVQDTEGRIIETNQAAADILGLTLDQLLERTTHDPRWRLIHEDGSSLTPDEQPSNVVRRTGRPVSGVLLGVYLPKEDRYRWIIVSSVPRFKDGRLCATMTTFTDVTDRKTAEEALRASTEKMSSIFRAAPTGIGVVRNRVLLEVNDRVCEMIGYSRDELIGRCSRILYPSDEEFEYVGREKYRQIAEKGTGSVETVWRRRDGTLLDVLLSSTPIVPGDLSSGVTFTATDITERKQSERRLRALIESAPFGALEYELRPDGRLIFVGYNQAANRILGVDCAQFIGMTIEEAFPPLEQTEVPDAYRRVASTGERYEDERVEYAHGRIAGAYEIAAYQTAPNRMAVLFRDITDRKRAEEDKRRFYRETIRSVTQGKLELVSAADLQGYLRSAAARIAVSSAEDTSVARLELEEFLQSRGLRGDECALFLTAVGEAMTNAVKHAGRGEVYAGAGNGDVWVAVSDAGSGIETFSIPSATLRLGYSTKASMGMGYSIMLDVSDKVMLATGPAGTTVLLVKSTSKREEGLRLEDLRDTWDSV